MVSDKQFTKVEDERQWEAIQTKTFQGWVNMHLEKIQDRVNNLETDLSDGVKLIRLLEVLNGSSIEGRYYKNPKSRPYKIDNINFALNFITDTLQVKLIGCSAEDIVDGNLKIILGMLWRLIQKFQLSTDNISRQSLLTWCRKVTEDRANINIENFHKSFQDGLAFCAIISAISPELIDFASLAQSESLQNLNVAFNIGEEQFDIPKLLDPIDVSSGHVDERSIMTYVSMWHKAYTDKLKPKKLGAPSEGSSSKPASDSAPLSARGESSGANLQQEIANLKAQNAELKKQLDAARENLRAAKAESEANANQVAALQSSLEALEKKHKETVQELENSKASLKNESAESQPAGESSSPAAPAEVKKEEVKEEKKEEVKEEVKEVKVEKAPEAEKPVSPKDDQSSSKVESLSKELEEAKEEIALLSKKYKKQQEKAIKKQQKRYEKTIKKKDRELDKLQTSTTAELRAKDEEIKTLLAELKKAQKTIGAAAAASSSEEAGQKPIDKDYEFLKSEYEDLLQIAQILEEDEKSMSKKYTKRADGEGVEGDDGAETETEGDDK